MKNKFLFQFKNKIFIRTFATVVIFSLIIFFIFSLVTTRSFEKILAGHLEEIEEYSENAEFLKETHDVFYSELGKLKRNSIFAFGASVFLSAFASYFISFRLTKNLKILADFVNKVGGGNLDANIKINSRDEFEILANSFNNMLSAVKSGQTELSNQKSAIEAIVMNLEDGVILFGENGKISIINKSAEFILNEKADSILDKNIKDLPTSNDLARLYEIMGKAIKIGVVDEDLIVWKDGLKIKYPVKAGAVVDKEGRFWGFVAIIKKVDCGICGRDLKVVT